MSEEPHFPAQATARVIVMVEKMREKSKKNPKDITSTKLRKKEDFFHSDAENNGHECNDD